MSRKKILAAFLGVALVGVGVLKHHAVRASDHDDGEIDKKGRALNLTDLYVFREDSEEMTPAGSKNNLVYIMNTHPRSLPNQQYYYSENARYEFHVARAASKSAAAATADDVIIRFEFGAPDSNNQQTITMTTIRDGVSTVTTTDDSGNPLKTTAAYTISSNLVAAASPKVMDLTVNGAAMKLFVGHRADPFFFNVTGFFKMRLQAAAASTQGQYVNAAVNNYLATAASNGAVGDNFTKQYNVSSIVLRTPISWLQKSGETVFDNWITISVRN